MDKQKQELIIGVRKSRKSIRTAKLCRNLGWFLGVVTVYISRDRAAWFSGATGVWLYFGVSNAYLNQAEKELDNLIVMYPGDQNEEERAETKKIVEIKVNEIENIVGATVKKGIEIEKVAILAQSRSLGFSGSGATLSVEGEEILHNIGKLIRDVKAAKINVIGHTYDMANEKSNKKISLMRAKAVKKHYIEKENISGENIEAIGMGSASGNERKQNYVDTVFSAKSGDLKTSKNLKNLSSLPGVVVRREPESVETKIIASKKAIYFEAGGSAIKQSSFPLLDRIADILEILPECKVYIEIAGDSGETAERNVNLSLQRAQKVSEYFVAVRKLAAERFTASGSDFYIPRSLKDDIESNEAVITLRWEYK